MLTRALNRNDVIKQSEGYIASDMDGEKVMLSVQNGKYYNLGEIGGEIWGIVEEPKSISEIIDALVAAYDVDPALCEVQVTAFLRNLAAEGLVQISA